MQTDSRTKIIAAARRAFYERGYDNTSFADIAKLSGIPKGNFYHHFPSKAALVDAVLEARMADVRRALSRWDADIDTPRLRLSRFAQMVTSETEDLVRFGCPVGSLVAELAKKTDDPTHAAALAVLELYVAWAAEQFAALGYGPKTARALGERMLSRCQGAILVTHAYGDPSILRRELRDVEKWLDETAAGA